MTQALSDAALDQLFRSARTVNKFTERLVDDATLKQLYALYCWGPTSMNCQPARVVFVRSAEAKQRMMPALMPNNVSKAMSAPVTAIVAFDSAFFEALPAQFPAVPGARDMFASNPALAAETAMRNGAMQGAYLILAARAMGMDAGPMSGFSAPLLDAAFFPDGRWKANFLVNLGWGDSTSNRPRGPRLAFEEAARIA